MIRVKRTHDGNFSKEGTLQDDHIWNLAKSITKNEEKTLPERKIELYENLYQFIMDRLKPHNFGCYSFDIPNLQDMLQTLGKFAWEALQNDVRQLLINKVGVQ